MKDLNEAFKRIIHDPILMDRLNSVSENGEYPSAPGGLRAYWDTKCLHNGWKLQKNHYFGHYRILDEYNVKRVLCAEREMISALEAPAVQNS